MVTTSKLLLTLCYHSSCILPSLISLSIWLTSILLYDSVSPFLLFLSSLCYLPLFFLHTCSWSSGSLCTFFFAHVKDHRVFLFIFFVCFLEEKSFFVAFENLFLQLKNIYSVCIDKGADFFQPLITLLLTTNFPMYLHRATEAIIAWNAWKKLKSGLSKIVTFFRQSAQYVTRVTLILNSNILPLEQKTSLAT